MALEEFYQCVYHDLFFKWIVLNASQYLDDHIICQIQEETDQYKIISFQMDKVSGSVTIWFNNIVEEQIFHHETNDLLFYLHYTILDLAQSKTLFEEFYKTLIKHNNQKEMNIAICSSDGFSTSVFVEEMMTACQLDNSPIFLKSLSLDELYQDYIHYDLIYLAPQIAYMEPELLNLVKQKVPIYSIDPMIFATKDYQFMLKTILNHAKRTSLC